MSKFEVLGFMGRSQSGKDLSGHYIANKYGFVPVALADVLKRFAKMVFPFEPETHLWGASQFRNEKVPVDWVRAQRNLVDHMSNWIASLALTIPEKASYHNVIRSWFEACQTHAGGGDISARVVLQLLGTEYGRSFLDSIWVDYFFEKTAKALSLGGSYHPHYGIAGGGTRNKGVVLTDLRFINELQGVRQHGGHVVRLIRLSQEGEQSGADKAGLPQHQSEMELQSIPLDQFDVVLRMEEGEDLARARLDKMMEDKEWETTPAT